MTDLPEIGDVIDGTYEIQSVLGTGGFGAVYRARQINMDRDVALKLLVAGGAKFEEMVERFRREVMAIRNLTHPNTIRVYDFRDNPEGLLYYTMEALDGRTLKDEVREVGPLSPLRLKYVMRQVLKSLSEAHTYNIVHRDLKPANIMLVDMHGETDFVKVLDFGIAKVLQETGEEGKEDLTSAGILVGTLRYMAPEQITGEPLGPHTDLYALGLIAVEMLSGESVFEGTGRWEVLQQQISEDPVAIPEVILQSGIGPVIRQCLEKRPEPRFSNSDDVLKALDAISDSDLDEEPLFISDGENGWMPRTSSSQTVPMDPLSKSDVSGEQKSMTIGSDPVDFDGKTVVTHVDEITSGHHQAPQPVQASPSQTQPQPVAKASGAPAHSPTKSTGVNPGFKQENTGQMAFAPSKADSNTTLFLVVGILLVLLIGGGTVIWLITSSKDADPETNGGEEVAVPTVVDEPVEPPEEVVVADLGSEDEELIHRVSVNVEGVRARVYVDDEVVGRTPYSLDFPIDEEVALILEARGYEDLHQVLNKDSPETLELVMTPLEEEEEDEPQAQATHRSEGTSGASRQNDRTQERTSERTGGTQVPSETGSTGAASDWIDIPSSDPPTDRGGSSGGSDDWVDIPSGTPEEEKEEEDEIPLF